jgi:hypothetical protein
MNAGTVASTMTRTDITAVQRGVLGRYFNAYRIAAYLMVLYTLGHTFGAVIGTPEFGPQSDAVAFSMKTVHVIVQGTERTWYDFYRGFGAFVSVFFLYSTWVAWYLGGLNRQTRRILQPITGAFVVAWMAGAVLAWQFFFAAPRIFSTVITLILITACVQDRRAAH